LGARRWERVYVRPYNAFIQRRRLAYNVDLLLGVLCLKQIVQDSGSDCNHETRWNDLANVHLSDRTNDIDLDIWPVLGMAQPAQHPRILEKEMLSKRGSSKRVERELTMSVASISLVDAMKPSENEGSAVLSMRSMAGFAGGASRISEDGAFRAPNRVML
jgi:hypothetical protein